MNEKHLIREQLVSLIERNEPLSEEAAAHLEQCPRCLALFETQVAAGSILPTRTYADDATIDRIAARSFAHLVPEERFSLHRFLSLPRITLAATAAALLIIAVYLGFGTPEITPNDRTADNKPAMHTAPSLAGTPKEFGSGSVVEHGRARITVHRDATLSAEGPDRITLARGTIEVSVEKGDDFRITVAERYLVRVLGTRFTLESDGPELKVTVAEGLVEVIDNGTNRSLALSAGMAHLFGEEARPAETTIAEKMRTQPSPATTAVIPETEVSFLQRGRAALKNGDDEEAMRWFRKEMAEGDEKDKALFEIVRILEKESRFGDILTVMKEHHTIVDGDSAYREELLIKACKAEVKEHVGTLPACREYLRLFPGGYKYEEIRQIVENRDE